MTLAFETETCKRCGGSGHYSYNSISGTRCFQCNGRKVQLTKRGQVARKRWVDSRSNQPLVAGQQYHVGVGIHGRVALVTFTHMEADTLNPGRYTAHFTEADGKVVRYGGITPDTGWTRASTRDELAAAIAYQNTLTKAGKPGRNTP